MEQEKSYRIRVKTLEGRLLTFNNVKGYDSSDGLIKFIDSKNQQPKIFSASNCEIERE